MIVKRYDKTRKCRVYDVRLRNEYGKMQYFAAGHTNKTLVRKYEAELKDQIKEWKMFPDRKIKHATFAEFVNKYYLPKHANSLKKKTKLDYISICKKLIREFGYKPMDAIERLDSETYLNRRYNEVSICMANREFNVLKGIFTKAELWGFRRKNTNPCKAGINGEKIKLKKEEPRWRVFTKAEIDKLLSECKKGSGEFRADEFKGILSIKKLCRTLANDGLRPDTLSDSDSIEWLNDILLLADLYDRVTSQKSDKKLTRRLKGLKKKHDITTDITDLIRLNRVLIEEFFAEQTPKMSKKATGLSQKEAIDLKDQIEISLNSGARKSEMLNIKVSDINFDTLMLQLFGKGNKTRFIPINSRLKEILERRVIGRKKYIFGKGNIAPKDFKKAFRSACKRAGIENARPHDLRRTFGTRCAMASIPAKILQKWMGHENIETTMKYYVQISEQFEKEAIERLTNFGEHDSQGDSSSKKGLSE